MISEYKLLTIDISSKQCGYATKNGGGDTICGAFNPTTNKIETAIQRFFFFSERYGKRNKDANNPITIILETPKTSFKGQYAFATQKIVLGAFLYEIAKCSEKITTQVNIYQIQANQWRKFYKEEFTKPITNIDKNFLKTQSMKIAQEKIDTILIDAKLTIKNDDQADALNMFMVAEQIVAENQPTKNLFIINNKSLKGKIHNATKK